MHVARTIPELRHHRTIDADGGPVVLVPTMGALHEGHLSLVRLARQKSGQRGHVAVSIFVNPTQFNDPGDLDLYPRTLDTDLELLEAAGVDMVFAPIDDEMYPVGEPQVLVDVPALAQHLEGTHRPGHFRGVCQVVLKLFNLVQPDLAVFGMKDFQQLRIIEAMTAGLNLPIDIVRGPTLRDSDGLALSSRNRRLNPRERQRARVIPRALDAAEKRFRAEEQDAGRLVEAMVDVLDAERSEVPFTLDYAACVDPQTLEPLETVEDEALLAIAAHVGPVRLIDNRLIG